jgi:hypothetical protein
MYELRGTIGHKNTRRNHTLKKSARILFELAAQPRGMDQHPPLFGLSLDRHYPTLVFNRPRVVAGVIKRESRKNKVSYICSALLSTGDLK